MVSTHANKTNKRHSTPTTKGGGPRVAVCPRLKVLAEVVVLLLFIWAPVKAFVDGDGPLALSWVVQDRVLRLLAEFEQATHLNDLNLYLKLHRPQIK